MKIKKINKYFFKITATFLKLVFSTETVAESQEESVSEEEVQEEVQAVEMETVYRISKRVNTYTTYEGEEKVVTTEYTYDENGNEVFSEGKNADGSFDHSFSSEYDENGKLLKEIYKNTSGETVYEYEYNENGDVIREVIKENGEVSQIVQREYDENNIQRKRSSVDGNNRMNDLSEYDENGTLIKQVFFMEGEVFSITEYNEHGDEIK